jgi:2-keto-3-deoxy-L-rhamnonate aldolase RhmA
VLTLWTADPAVAARADAAGIDRVGVDLERLGKAERQRGLGTWISPHAEADLGALAPMLSRAALFARVNPINPDSRREIEAVIAHGARVLMLPMVETRDEAGRFVDLVGGRAGIVLLVERGEALAAVGPLAAVEGVDEIHVGLNDLALSLGLPNRWLALAGDRLSAAADAVRAAGKRFGFGGIGAVDDAALPIPSDLIYAEYARLGATAALVARAFPLDGDLAAAVTTARARLARWRSADAATLAAAHAELEGRAAGLARW